MTELPILMSAPMVRACLAGSKTQTRRVIKGASDLREVRNVLDLYRCPYGVAGDRLWVRENGWERPERSPKMMREGADTWPPYLFDAHMTDMDHEIAREQEWKRRPSIHMPRIACRLLLDVTAVRVERLQQISEADSKAEGVAPAYPPGVAPVSYRLGYSGLWDSLNRKRGFGWSTNPWVWVVEFKAAA